MPARALMLTVALVLSVITRPASAEVRALILSGLGGEPAYEQKFQQQAAAMAQAAGRAGAAPKDIVELTGDRAKRTTLDGELKKFARGVQPDDQVIVALIGHGSYDGDDYRFNLPGPDITGKEIAAFLDSMAAAQVLVVNATSSSGAVMAFNL